MLKIVIPKTHSKNFTLVIEESIAIGGVYDGNEILINISDDMKAYDLLLPLMRLNVFNWKKTKAYCNDVLINPYKHALKWNLKKKLYTNDVLEQLDLSEDEKPYLYYKREGNTFYFKNDQRDFKTQFFGKELYYFVDQYSIGDIVEF